MRTAPAFSEVLSVSVPPAGLLQILNGNLHGKERVAQFVRKTPRQFAPCGDALGLHQTLLLRRKRLRHVIERFSKLADFIASTYIDARVPSSAGNFAGAFGKFLDRFGDPRGDPETDEQSDE